MRISLAVFFALAACKPSTSFQDAPVVASVAPVASSAPGASGPASPPPAVSGSGAALGLGSIPDARQWNTTDRPNDVIATPDSPKGDVAVVALTVTGGTIADADRVVAGLRPRFRQCYQKGLQAHPKTAGKVSITAKVDANGEVGSATGSPEGGLEPEVSTCMTSMVKRAVFSPPGASGATLTIKTTLKPQTP